MAQKLNNLADKRDELQAINAKIVERQRYQRNQEKQINDLVESGNTQLMGLHHDILMAKQELRNIKTDIRTAAQDKVLLNQDLDSIRDEIRDSIQPTIFVGAAPAFG